MNARVHVFVSGRVQGVFFRAETEDFAGRHRLKGWVRNLPDGRVEAVFEGDNTNVEKAIEFCRRGPPGAYVRDLQIIWEDWRGEFDDFRVTH